MSLSKHILVVVALACPGLLAHCAAANGTSESVMVPLTIPQASSATTAGDDAAVPVVPQPPPRSALCARAASSHICLSYCDELVARLHARIASNVVTCLQTANSGETCVPPAAYACVQRALTGVKPSAGAEQACDRLARMCAGQAMADGWRTRCSEQFAALTDRGREAVIACMTASQCAGMPYFNDDVGSCLFDDHAA